MNISRERPASQEPQEDRETISNAPHFIIQDYWVDLFGGLLPGTLISIAIVLSIAPATLLLINAIRQDYESSIITLTNDLLTSTHQTPSMIWFGVSTVLFSLFYVLGHMFYRQDPKKPNQESFELLKKEIIDKHQHLSERKLRKKLKKELACTRKEECEFPFPYFREYLKNRGLIHLLNFAPWSKKNANFRTKNYINILKIRLRFHYPSRCGTIIRNEAHIRLASSTWYAGGAIFKLFWISIAITSLSAAILGVCTLIRGGLPPTNNSGSTILSQYAGTLMISLFLFLIGKYLRKRIEKFMHYQRMREVVHVMETAYVAFKDKPELICPPFCTKAMKAR